MKSFLSCNLVTTLTMILVAFTNTATAIEPPIINELFVNGIEIPVPPPPDFRTFYIRPDGGNYTQCNGLANTAYPGSGDGLTCAVNHLFELLPPGGTARIDGGDTVIIGSGSYRMGYTAGLYDSGDCKINWGYNCVATAIPSGPDKEHTTKIYGEGWDTRATKKPELWGTERAKYILDIGGNDNIDIRYLEITDHEDCTYNAYSAEGVASSTRCERSSTPRGDHADYGINNVIAGSNNVLLKDLNIHGLTIGGIKSGGISNWTIDGVRIYANSFVGWDFDIDSGVKNTGDIIFRNSQIQYSGCAETYPGGEPHNCYSQAQGGYGDAIGTELTGGNWLIENVNISYNVSDGLDLLYGDGDITVTIKNSRFESNTGNQVKVSGDLYMENSILIGNCEYFATTNHDLQIESDINFDVCRANGDTILFKIVATGQKATLVNNTILARSTVMIDAKGDGCNGTETFTARNNIFYGDRSYLKYVFDGSIVRPNLFYLGGTDGNGAGSCGPSNPATAIKIDNKYNLTYQTKGGSDDCLDSTSICSDPSFNGPLFTGEDTDVTLRSGSIAIGQYGLGVGEIVYEPYVVPSTDYLGANRLDDGTIDWGAYKY